MHDEPLSQNDLSPIAGDSSDFDHVKLDKRIVRVLETVPSPRIPADFAALVASRLPVRRPVSLTATHYGQSAMLLGIVATLTVLVVLALHTTGHASFGLLELFLLAEFIGLTVWFSVSRYGLR
jgi:hypothetical protein